MSQSPGADSLTRVLYRVIRYAVRVLSVLMAAVIVLGVIDVAWTLHQRAMAAPRFILSISDILATFGAFMAVLIAIEIFVNITLYLRDDVIQVKIVLATALMAISRKIIILDYKEVEPPYIYATAAVALAMSLGYWLVAIHGTGGKDPSSGVSITPTPGHSLGPFGGPPVAHGSSALLTTPLAVESVLGPDWARDETLHKLLAQGSWNGLDRIVLATDLSAASLRAFTPVIEIARGLSWNLTLLHVVHDTALGGLDSVCVHEDIEAAKLFLEGVRGSLSEEVEINIVVLPGGDIARTITKYAAEHAAILALSTHGRSGVRRMVLGSVAASALRLSTVPVFCFPLPHSKSA